MSACRDALLALHDDKSIKNGSNADLILSRYLKEQKQEGNNDGEESRNNLFKTAVSAVNNLGRNNPDFYKLAFDRRARILGGTTGAFEIINGRMVLGLGEANVLETGLTLNPIYGTPLIPGSALKGLAAHYCAAEWGNNQNLPNFKGPARNNRGVIVAPAGDYYGFMFGSTEDAGFLTFHDAWIKPSSLSGSLVHDVMTPHHGNYYTSQGTDAPTEFDDPNPVTFLSIKGVFEIRVTCEDGGTEGKDWETLAMELLKQALKSWGIGGKTSSGYGMGTLKFSGGQSAHGSSSSANPAAAASIQTQPFSAGQQVEAVYNGKNKKGNHQIEVILDNEPIKAIWDGGDPGVPRGTRITVIVKSYNRNSTPPLILAPL